MKSKTTKYIHFIYLINVLFFINLPAEAQQYSIAELNNAKSQAINMLDEYENLLRSMLDRYTEPNHIKLLIDKSTDRNSNKQLFDKDITKIEMDQLIEEYKNGSGSFKSVNFYLKSFHQLFKNDQYSRDVDIQIIKLSDIIQEKKGLTLLLLFKQEWKFNDKNGIPFESTRKLAHFKFEESSTGLIPIIINISYYSVKQEKLFEQTLKKGDNDKDGISNEKDKCPDRYGLKDLEGCPDSDGDGFSDDIDKCPKEVGTKMGCPQDQDNDRIPDSSDKCPTQYGSLRFEGCPDSDEDGVPDNKDDCPNIPGDKNGCPSNSSVVKSLPEKESSPPNPKQGELTDFEFFSQDPITTHKKKVNFGKRIHLGVNLQVIQAPYNVFLESFDDIRYLQNDYKVQLRDLSFSFYAPIGVFFSNFQNTDNPVPYSYFTWSEINLAKQNLGSQPYIDLHSPVQKSDLLSFNAGMYVAPFFKHKGWNYFHLMGGVAHYNGFSWTEYQGDFLGELRPQNNNTPYNLDFTFRKENGFVAGLAFVMPFLQMEFGYNSVYQQLFYNAGINIPLSTFYSN